MKNVFMIVAMLTMVSGSFGFSEKDFFPTLISNTPDITSGTAEFQLCNPLGASVQISGENLRFSFVQVKGSVKDFDFFMASTENISTSQEISLVNYSLDKGKQVKGDTLKITKNTTKEETVINPLKTKVQYLPAKECRTVLLTASWPPAISGSPVAIDWVPSLNLSGLYFANPAWAWWNVSWQFVQNVSVSGSTANMTSFPVRLFFNSTNTGAGFNWSLLGNDVRFLDSNNFSRPFWIQEFNTGSNFTVWVTAPVLTGSNTLKMYYGNTNATNISSYSNFVITKNASGTTYTPPAGHIIFNGIGASWTGWSQGQNVFIFPATLNASPIDLAYDGGLSASNCGYGGSCECHQITQAGKLAIYCSFNSGNSCGNCNGYLSFNSHTVTPSPIAAGGYSLLVNSVSYAVSVQNLSYQINPSTTPIITIQSPANQTYTTASVPLSYSISNAPATDCNYELDDVSHALNGCVNTTLTVGHGSHKVRVLNADSDSGGISSYAYFSNDLLIYINALDESTGAPLTFNVSLNNISVIKTSPNQVLYIGNYTGDPRGTITLLVSAAGHQSRTFYLNWTGTQKANFTAYLPSTTEAPYQYTLSVINSASSSPVFGAVFDVRKNIGGAWINVASGVSDSSGSFPFYLIPLSSYEVTVSHPRFSAYTGLITPMFTEVHYFFMLAPFNNLNFSTVWSNVRIQIDPNVYSVGANGSINWTVASGDNALEWFSLNLSSGFFSNISNSSGGTITGNFTNQNTSITGTFQFKKADYPVQTFLRTFYIPAGSMGANGTLDYTLRSIGSSLGSQGKAFMALAATAGAVFIGGAAAGPVGSGLLGVGVLAGSYYFDWIDQNTVILTIIFFFALSIIYSEQIWR